MDGGRILAQSGRARKRGPEKLLADALSEVVYMECMAARRELGAAESAELVQRVQEISQPGQRPYREERMNEQARKRLIFALDVDSFEEAASWVSGCREKVGVFKVGKQLFTRCGPEVVQMIRDKGGEVFLDLKYHDIPNTVAMAGLEAAGWGCGCSMSTPWAAREMMERAARGDRNARFRRGARTSSAAGRDHPDLHALRRLCARSVLIGRWPRWFRAWPGSPRRPEWTAWSLPPGRSALIREACGRDFAIVTPGVRPAFACSGRSEEGDHACRGDRLRRRLPGDRPPHFGGCRSRWRPPRRFSTR